MPPNDVIRRNHRYIIREAPHRRGSRYCGFTVTVRLNNADHAAGRGRRRNPVAFARNNSAQYEVDSDTNPHNLDVNWYLDNYNAFYERFGAAVADYLEENQEDWSANINWPNTIHARIHGENYNATKIL